MKLSGLHLLLTYQCLFECDHCFVWGSPWQSGVMDLNFIDTVLSQARDTTSIKSIYFEGGEPFLYYPILVAGVMKAREFGFEVGIVSNAYWATSWSDAYVWLAPFKGFLNDLTISSDLFHYSQKYSTQYLNATRAAKALDIPLNVISVETPKISGVSEKSNNTENTVEMTLDECNVMYRGRAVEKLAPSQVKIPWQEFNSCPFEDLESPGRIHLDPFGNLHICQGIVIGNIFEKPLEKIQREYQPADNPLISALLSGGPAEVSRRFGILPDDGYADACHFCYMMRSELRNRYPDILKPDQMYGNFS